MKVARSKNIYVLVSRDFIGEDKILFVTNSYKAAKQWLDYYNKYYYMVVEIVKTRFYSF